jgi:large subunit ribosomal protein L21
MGISPKTLDDKLSFKGRIDRDEWIKQANEFMKG